MAARRKAGHPRHKSDMRDNGGHTSSRFTVPIAGHTMLPGTIATHADVRQLQRLRPETVRGARTHDDSMTSLISLPPPAKR